MYALERNAWKYEDRDKRILKTQHIEYDYLAPDTINDIFDSLDILKKLTPNDKGEGIVSGWENTQRDTVIVKVPQSIKVYNEMIRLYGCMQCCIISLPINLKVLRHLKKTLSAKLSRSKWLNIGGQLIIDTEVEQLKRAVKTGKVKGWESVHSFYQAQGSKYELDKLNHAYTGLLEILNITSKQFTPELLKNYWKKCLSQKSG